MIPLQAALFDEGQFTKKAHHLDLEQLITDHKRKEEPIDHSTPGRMR